MKLESINDLLERQKELNSHLDKMPTQEQLFMAYIAEIGELSQSLKWQSKQLTEIRHADFNGWCWWKRKQVKAKTKNQVLGEWVDCVHFAASNQLIFESKKERESYPNFSLEEIIHDTVDRTDEDETLVDEIKVCINHFMDGESVALITTLLIGYHLGFTIKDFQRKFKASCKKNLERWQ